MKYKLVFFLLKWSISALLFYSSLIYTILSLVNLHLLNYTLVNIFSKCWFFYSCIYSFIIKKGTIPEIDALIKDPFVLKAISFSVNYKDSVYKDVLVNLILLKLKIF